MRKAVFAFIFLTAILILGILIVMKPHFFVSHSQNDKFILNQRLVQINIPKEIILLGSLLIVIGLGGLSVLGFRLFKELQDEPNTKIN